ncbi:hypothetical protein [Spirosoma litoris]
MDKETVSYIINYYSHLLNTKEKLVLRHQQSLYKLDNSDGRETEEQNQRRKAMYVSRGWLSTDKDVLDLLKDGYEAFEVKVAAKLLAEFPEKVFLNNCPNCGRLARTPLARQCRFCGYDWHSPMQS